MKAPAFWSQHHSWQTTLLSPLAALYQLVDRLTRAAANPLHFDKPVICVGNVVAGGAGKTPTAIAVARLLIEQGQNIAFVTRGYGGTAQGPMLVEADKHTFRDVGDEAMLLAGIAPTVVAKNRVAGIKTAFANGAAIVIMDDGLQNTTVAPDLNLLVIDGPYGLGNGLTLPAGPLREPWQKTLDRAHATLIIGQDLHLLAEKIHMLAPEQPVITATLTPEWPEAENNRGNFYAFAGIGRPEKFYATCRDMGLHLSGTEDFPDHHAYTISDWAELCARAERQGARLITTEKDAMRLQPEWLEQVVVLPITLKVRESDRMRQALKTVIPVSGT